MSQEQSTDIARRMEALPVVPLHRRLARVICIGMFLDGFDTLCLAAALTVLIGQLKIPFSQVGLLLSAAFGGMLVGAILFGALSERFGRKKVFVFCAGLFGLFSILNGLTWDFWSLFTCRFIQGLGFGGAVPVGSALIVEYLPAKERGRIFSLNFSLLFTLGFIVAPLAGALTLWMFGPVFGWRALFFIGGLALPYAFYAAYALPESPRWLASRGRVAEAQAEVERLEAESRAIGHVPEPAAPTPAGLAGAGGTRVTELFSADYRSRTFVVSALFLAVAFVQYGFNGWLPTLYVSVGGLQPQYALALAVGNGVIIMAFTVVYALTVDTFGRRNWIMVGFAMSVTGIAIGLIGVYVYDNRSWQLLFGSSILTVVGSGINTGAIYLYSLEMFPTRIRSLGSSLGSAFTRLGSILAPILIGVILQAGFGLPGVFLLLGACCVIGFAAIALFGIETRQKTLEEIAR